jgi:hypothetical protein
MEAEIPTFRRLSKNKAKRKVEPYSGRERSGESAGEILSAAKDQAGILGRLVGRRCLRVSSRFSTVAGDQGDVAYNSLQRSKQDCLGH